MTVDVHPIRLPCGPLSDGQRALFVVLVLFLDRRFPGALNGDDNEMSLVFRLVVLAAPVASLEVGGLRHERGSLGRSALAWVVIGLALTS